jgi:hypothetical protein
VISVGRHLFVYYFAFSSLFAHGGLDWSPEKRIPIRQHAANCSTFLAPAEPTVNDSVGIVLSTSDIEDFEKNLDAVVAERGESAVLGGHFYVTGIAMGEERATRSLFEEALEKRKLLRNGTSVTVISIPKKDVAHLAKQTLQAVVDRVRYFFPSIARHYEAPLKGEVTAGLLSNVAIELPNIVYLYNHMPLIDANLAVTTHTAILFSYIVFSKFMLNWLLDPKTTRLEGFFKNALLSVPFVVNYSVFGNFSKIVGFYKDNGWDATLAQFPTELANFGTTQGLTIFLQVLFYQIVITQGLGKWQDRQTGRENSEKARTITKVVQTPILVGDAITLAMAGANAHPLLSFGAFDVNTGHVALAALTLVGSILYFKSSILDPTLKWHDSFANVWKKVAGLFKAHSTSTDKN